MPLNSTETADANGNKENTTTVSKFEEKIEPSSAKMYFHYYGQLLHQQNMMQDYVRTGNGIPSFVCCSSYTSLWMCELVMGYLPLFVVRHILLFGCAKNGLLDLRYMSVGVDDRDILCSCN
jgi:hypothetical protein